MLGEVQIEEAADSDATAKKVRALDESIQAVTARLDRLMTAYIEGVLTLPEYRDGKNKLMDEKRQLDEKKAAIEENGSSAFEPVKTFLNATKQAGILAETGTDEEKRDFLKTVTSNLTIKDRHLSFIPRDAWKLVVDQGRLAQHNAAPDISGAAFVGETNPDLQKRR